MSSVERYAIISNGIVINTIMWDGKSEAGLNPDEESILLQDDDAAGVGYTYNNGVFSPPPLTEEEKKLQAQLAIQELIDTKSALMTFAGNKISTLSDAVELEMATLEEEAELTLWKKYRVLLNRVDIKSSPEIDWPTIPGVIANSK